MLKTCFLVRNTHTYVVSENIAFSSMIPHNFADVSIFDAKNQHFLSKIVPLLKTKV